MNCLEVTVKVICHATDIMMKIQQSKKEKLYLVRVELKKVGLHFLRFDSKLNTQFITKYKGCIDNSTNNTFMIVWKQVIEEDYQ